MWRFIALLFLFISYSLHAGEDSLARRFRELEDSVAYFEKRGDELSRARAVYRLGHEHYKYGDINLSQDNLEKAALIYQKLGKTDEVARIEQLFGNIQSSFRNFEEALKFYHKAFAHFSKTGDKFMIASLHNNFGIIYNETGDTAKAAYEFFTSLSIRLSMGDSTMIGQSYNNIGALRYNMGKYAEALEYYRKGLAYRMNTKAPVTSQLESKVNIGKTLIRLMRFQEAEGVLKSAYMGAHAQRAVELKRRCVAQLKELYKLQGRFAEAYAMQEEYYVITDSLFSIQKRNETLKAGIKYAYEQRIQHDSLKREEEKRIALLQQAREEEIQNEKNLRLFILIGSLVLVLLLVGYVALILQRSNKEKKRVNEVITAQRDQLEERNKEIRDSVLYGKRIQDALLSSGDEIKNIFPDSFIFYQPKDIISGDFYWAETVGDRTWIALADCTGHGVPGAMMSMLGISFLNEALREKGESGPARILDELHKKVVSSLNRNQNVRELNDGMDIALLCVDRKRNMVSFALAARPILHVSGGERKLIKGERYSIGGMKEVGTEPYRQLMISVKPGDSIFLYSDGFADQFGGKDKKKYKSRRLENLLQQVATLSATDRMPALQKEFNEWKGSLEQVDDVCVIGLFF